MSKITANIETAESTGILKFDPLTQLADTDVDEVVPVIAKLKEFHVPDLSLLSKEAKQKLIDALLIAPAVKIVSDDFKSNGIVNTDSVLKEPEISDLKWRNQSLETYINSLVKLLEKVEANKENKIALNRLSMVYAYAKAGSYYPLPEKSPLAQKVEDVINKAGGVVPKVY